MKKITILFTLILMGFGFSGCGESQANKPQTITAEQNIQAVLNDEIKERLISDYVLNREGLCRNGDERDCLENRRDKFNLKLQSSADVYFYLRQKDSLNESNKKRLSKEAKIEIISTTLIPKRTEAFVKFKVVEPKKKTRTYRIYLKYTLEEAGKEPQNPFGFKVNLYMKEEIGRSKQGGKK